MNLRRLRSWFLGPSRDRIAEAEVELERRRKQASAEGQLLSTLAERTRAKDRWRKKF